MLIVLAGFSGSGKSYIAKKLSKYLNCPHLNSDKIRKDIAHITSTKHIFENFGEGLYSKKMTELTYNNLINKGKKLLEKEKNVILDATFSSIDMQEKLKNCGEEYIFFWCYATDDIIKERLNKRLKEKDNISDATWEIYLKQKENFKGFVIPEDKLYKIDTSKDDCFQKIVKIIGSVENGQ